MTDIDRERFLEAMEQVTGEDRDISILWWPELAGGGQGTQREFLDRVLARYEMLAEGRGIEPRRV
jgi:hypothetical protein